MYVELVLDCVVGMLMDLFCALLVMWVPVLDV